MSFLARKQAANLWLTLCALWYPPCRVLIIHDLCISNDRDVRFLHDLTVFDLLPRVIQSRVSSLGTFLEPGRTL